MLYLELTGCCNFSCNWSLTLVCPSERHELYLNEKKVKIPLERGFKIIFQEALSYRLRYICVIKTTPDGNGMFQMWFPMGDTANFKFSKAV